VAFFVGLGMPRGFIQKRKNEMNDEISHLEAEPLLRVSKQMTALGLCSRREADEYIERGWVKVDGQVVVLGQKMSPNQTIEIASAAQRKQAARVTVLLNKPVGIVSSQPEKNYQAAIELITAENQWNGDKSGIRFSPAHLQQLAAAGRLDIESVGLLVLTQDGRVAKNIIGENADMEKGYLVRVEGELIEGGLRLLNHGLSLDDQPLLPANVTWQNADQLLFVLKEGKKRQIRRMCELVGLKVVGLKRIRIGRVMLGDLPVGKWRYLLPTEKF
jgi:23S rRNA pseudouridine2604 synthase